jgi:chemotaxis protein MotB
MAKKKKGPIIKKGLDDWMATYADMVTLLFCFFVMLYSASNQEEARFQYILQAFNTTGRYVNVIVGRPPEPPLDPSGLDLNTDIPPQDAGTEDGSPPGRTNQPSAFDALYNQLAEAIEEDGVTGVQIYSRPGLIRVVLQGDVVFAPDSYLLNAMGQRVLDVITPVIQRTEDWIRSVQVQGHTAATTSPGVGMNDWELSSMRAVTVVRYLDDVNRMVSSEKFIVEGFAQYSPSSDDAASNRRVEIIINRIDLSEEENRFVDDIMMYDYNSLIFDVDAVGDIMEPQGTPVETVVAGILGDLTERYGNPGDTPRQGHGGGMAVGPTPGGFATVRDTDFTGMAVEEPPPENGNGNGNGNGE